MPVIAVQGQVRPVGSIAFLSLPVNCTIPPECACDFCVNGPSQGGGKLMPLLTTKPPLMLCAKIVRAPIPSLGHLSPMGHL